MTQYRLLLTATVLFLCMASTAVAAGTFHTSWRTVSFDTPIEMSPPVEIGLDAVTVTDPPDAPHGKALMEITLVAIPKDLREGLGNSDSEVLKYVTSTFLGTSKPAAKAVERSFLGRPAVGELLFSKIPAPREIELYLVHLSDGESVAVAFCRGLDVSRERFVVLVEMAARTFRESAQGGDVNLFQRICSNGSCNDFSAAYQNGGE
jgi:hypothetical protein